MLESVRSQSIKSAELFDLSRNYATNSLDPEVASRWLMAFYYIILNHNKQYLDVLEVHFCLTPKNQA